MKLFRVAAVVVVVAEVPAEALVAGVPAEARGEGAVVEVAIADLAEVAVRSGIRAADGQVAQGQASALPPEGQALLGAPRTTVRYATVPRSGPLCLDVLAKLVMK